MSANITPEKLAVVEKCLDDGWSQVEIYRTHKVHPATIRRHFPGRGWTLKQGAELGYLVAKRFAHMNHA